MTVHSVQDEGAEPIAVVGIAARVPGAADTAQFWENLVAGVESLTPLRRERMAAAGATEDELDDENLVAAGFVLEDVDQFDARLFGMTPGRRTSPTRSTGCSSSCATARWSTPATTRRATRATSGSTRAGAPSGTGGNTCTATASVLATTPSMSIGVGNLSDYVTTLVSYKLNLRGPSVAVFTACSTSLVDRPHGHRGAAVGRVRHGSGRWRQHRVPPGPRLRLPRGRGGVGRRARAALRRGGHRHHVGLAAAGRCC